MFLVDTHVAAWWVLGDSSLGPRCRDLIESGHTIWVSSVSLSEMVIKSMVGRWTLPDHVPASFVDHGFRVLEFSGAHALGLRALPELAHHDPFDRMLVAQAKVERLTFLTADRRLLGLDHEWILDATK